MDKIDRCVAFLSALFLVVPLSASAGTSAERLREDIEESHIDGNVPPSSDFRKIFLRDLKAYFSNEKQLKQTASVDVDLLRDAPTQSGIGFPHYYAWAAAYDKSGKTLLIGAVRLDAIAKKSFGITDFVSMEGILKDSSCLEGIFPEVLREKILIKAQGARHRKIGI